MLQCQFAVLGLDIGEVQTWAYLSNDFNGFCYAGRLQVGPTSSN